jgi:phage terminase large subunit GpA-like protein
MTMFPTLLDRRALRDSAYRLLGGSYFTSARSIFVGALEGLTPPEQISTTQAAERFRYVDDGQGGKMLWSRDLTPYCVEIQDALDDPRIQTVAVMGPGRVGKTVPAENYAFKRMQFGPPTDCLWYLPSGDDVREYCDTVINPMFDLHPALKAKIGTRPSDNQKTRKRIAGQWWRFLPMAPNTVRNRQARFRVADEVDGFRPTMRKSFLRELQVRGRRSANQGKTYVCSHPDEGERGGIYPVWQAGTRGRWYWHCPHCKKVSSPYPGGHWNMRLVWRADDGVSEHDMLDQVERTAALECPHCKGLITNEHRLRMNIGGFWLHDGQEVTEDGEVSGSIAHRPVRSYAIHGTMSPFVTLGELARQLVEARLSASATQDDAPLKSVMVKSFGELFAGSDELATFLTPGQLAAKLIDRTYALGEVPSDVLFLTAVVDIQANRFEVGVIGWGRDGESWLIDRFRIDRNQRGIEVRPAERQSDWALIQKHVIDRWYPLQDDPNYEMPIASTAIDSGGQAGVTPKAREFVRQQMVRLGAGEQYRIRLIKGSSRREDPEVGTGKPVDRDDNGRPIDPPIIETQLGVFRIKKVIAKRIRQEPGSPAWMHIPGDAPRYVFSELCSERFVEGDWVKSGANETWDIYIYAEAVRLMLKPDRPSINWEASPPRWARPRRRLNAKPDVTETNEKPKRTALDRLAAHNRQIGA